jgi:hypothetical protein
MQLRYLNSLADFAGERASTVILPLPMDLLARFGAAQRVPPGD